MYQIPCLVSARFSLIDGVGHINATIIHKIVQLLYIGRVTMTTESSRPIYPYA